MLGGRWHSWGRCVADPNLGLGRGYWHKRTPERIQTIKNILAIGLGYGTAARAAGVNKDTLLEWRKDDPVLSAELETIKAMFIGGVTLKAVQAASRGEAWAIKLILQARSEEFRPREKVDEGRSPEDQAHEIASLIDAMDANILDGAEGRKGIEKNGAANGIEVRIE